MSPGNVLVCQLENNYLFYLIDTNRMKFGQINEEKQHKNFSMLWAKDNDLYIIVNAYAMAAGLDPVYLYKKISGYSDKHKRYALRKQKIKRWLGR